LHRLRQQRVIARSASGRPGTVSHNGAMKAPRRRQPLIEEGLIDSVVRQLMSGKETAVDVVRCGEETRCAKVCKCASSKLDPRVIKVRA